MLWPGLDLWRNDVPTKSLWGIFLKVWYPERLLLDSRGVDLSMASNPTFVFLSSLEPLFFNSPENGLRFSDNTGA
jgi:hypothetical protein